MSAKALMFTDGKMVGVCGGGTVSTSSKKNKYKGSSIRRVIERITVGQTKLGQDFHPNAGLLESLGLDPELENQALWNYSRMI